MSEDDAPSSPGAARAPPAPMPTSFLGVEKVDFEYVNMLVHQEGAADRIELLVNVPLVDGSVAETKVVIGSPVKFLRRDGRSEYSNKVDSNLTVTQTQKRATGRADLQNRDGLWWEIPVGYPGAWTVLLEHEPKVKEYLGSRFAPGKVFADVGANVGAYTLRAMSRGMKVYPFEPNPENVKLLKRNAEINHLPVQVQEFALGSSEGTANLSQNGATSRISDMMGVSVPVRTLDSFGLQQVDLLKVDVEGYELEVFKGARETLARCHPDIMIEMHHWIGAEAEAALFNILLENDYRFEYLDTYSQGRHLTAERKKR
jgi:FkbM family methyltransferase